MTMTTRFLDINLTTDDAGGLIAARSLLAGVAD